MQATGWQNGSGYYGIRVGKKNAATYFDKSWTSIEVEIDGHGYAFSLRETFWKTCPEFRGAAAGAWLLKNGLAPWPSRCAPAVVLTPMGANRFRLSM
jgi:hypothetical protein